MCRNSEKSSRLEYCFQGSVMPKPKIGALDYIKICAYSCIIDLKTRHMVNPNAHSSSANLLSPRQVAFCDGACNHQKRVGGWGYRVERPSQAPLELSGAVSSGSSIEMEVIAAVMVLRNTPRNQPLHVHCDCREVVEAVARIQGKPTTSRCKQIKRLGAYLQLSKLVQRRDVIFSWIPGHTGIKGNERVDGLAKAAMREAVRAIGAAAGRC